MNLAAARRIIEAWRIDYNTERPHTSLDGLTPVALHLTMRTATSLRLNVATPLYRENLAVKCRPTATDPI